MVAALVLITGILLVMLVGGAMLWYMGIGGIITSLLPLVPWLVMVGTVLIIATELLLLFGGRDDRRAALRDLTYLVPPCLVSGGLWWFVQRLAW
jgi:hypothetical protein